MLDYVTSFDCQNILKCGSVGPSSEAGECCRTWRQLMVAWICTMLLPVKEFDPECFSHFFTAICGIVLQFFCFLVRKCGRQQQFWIAGYRPWWRLAWTSMARISLVKQLGCPKTSAVECLKDHDLRHKGDRSGYQIDFHQEQFKFWRICSNWKDLSILLAWGRGLIHCFLVRSPRWQFAVFGRCWTSWASHLRKWTNLGV